MATSRSAVVKIRLKPDSTYVGRSYVESGFSRINDLLRRRIRSPVAAIPWPQHRRRLVIDESRRTEIDGRLRRERSRARVHRRRRGLAPSAAIQPIDQNGQSGDSFERGLTRM